MIVEFNLTNIIFVLIALFSGFWAIAKFFLEKSDKSQAARDKALAEALEADRQTTLQLERDFLRLQVELPQHYVRREDYIRGQSVIEAKLDGLGTKIEMAQLRALQSIPFK